MVNHHIRLHMNDNPNSSNILSINHVGDLDRSWYAFWITFGGVKLIHIHGN
jgi:hypothetical protein